MSEAPPPFSPALTTTADANGNFAITNFSGNAGQTYTLEASATNKVGTSGYSNEVTFTILVGTPAAPSSFHLGTDIRHGYRGRRHHQRSNACFRRYGLAGRGSQLVRSRQQHCVGCQRGNAIYLAGWHVDEWIGGSLGHREHHGAVRRGKRDRYRHSDRDDDSIHWQFNRPLRCRRTRRLPALRTSPRRVSRFSCRFR